MRSIPIADGGIALDLELTQELRVKLNKVYTLRFLVPMFIFIHRYLWFIINKVYYL